MGDVAVEIPPSGNTTLPKAVLSDAIPDIDLLEGTANDDGDEYSILKRYQRQLEYDYTSYTCLSSSTSH